VTVNPSDLILAASSDIGTGATTGGPTNSFMALSEAANSNKIVPAYRVVTAAGSYSTSWTEPNGGWDTAIVALKGSGSTSVPGAAFVQQQTATYASAASVVVNLNAAPHAGSALVLFSANNTVGVTGVSGGGVSWVRASLSGAHSVNDIWYGLNSSGSGTAITVSYASAAGSGGINVSEFSGIVTSNALDAAPLTTFGISTTPTTLTTVTANAKDLILAASSDIGAGATSGGPTNSFIALSEAANSNKIVPAYRIVTATGSYGTSWTEPNGGWDTAIVVLKSQ